jgi:hypothetical protein
MQRPLRTVFHETAAPTLSENMVELPPGEYFGTEEGLIAITPEMIEAGAIVIWDMCADGMAWGCGHAELAAERVFREMMLHRR